MRLSGVVPTVDLGVTVIVFRRLLVVWWCKFYCCGGGFGLRCKGGFGLRCEIWQLFGFCLVI